MNNVIGIPARGHNFFLRKREIKKIIKLVEEGGSIQLAAPRRVGKTSILMYLLDNKLDNNHYLYIDTEAVTNSNDFFKKIYAEIIKSAFVGGSAKIIEQIKRKANSFLRKIKGINIMGTGLELLEVEDLAYYNELTNLIKGIEFERGKIVLMIDEFPYTINNIIEEADDSREAITFLKKNRALRQDPEINSKIQFIYTGSIGLNTTIENLKATSLINDIMSVKVSPLKPSEGEELVKKIVKYEQKTISGKNITYLLERIEWLTPFYIKLMIKEIVDIMEDHQTEIDHSLIDDSFQEIIDYRNNNYFEHYYSRLKGFFSGNEFKFIIALLNYITDNNSVKKAEIYNIATKFNLQEDYRSLIHTLIYDGYIHSHDNGDSYTFNSPILKLWWKKYVSN